MTTCHAIAEIKVSDCLQKRKEWPELDVMKTSAAYGWARRAFNSTLKSAGKDQIVTAHYAAEYGPPNHTRTTGVLSGVNGRQMAERGIFER